MKKLSLFAAILLTACGARNMKQKPFVIVQKFQQDGYTKYYYDCPNCFETFSFDDSTGKYNVGDTIN